MLSKKNKLITEKITAINGHAAKASRKGAWKIATDLPSSFRYASQGLIYAFSSQRNFRIHVFLGAVSFAFGIWLDLDLIKLAILVLTVAAVLVLELINTAIEAVVDLSIGRSFHPLAKISKDCSAASVLVASISSLLVAILLLFPPFISRIGM